jgi:hypothetical protein
VTLRISLGRYDGGRRTVRDGRGEVASVDSGELTVPRGDLELEDGGAGAFEGNGVIGGEIVGIRVLENDGVVCCSCEGRSIEWDPRDKCVDDAEWRRGSDVGQIAEPPNPYGALLDPFADESPHASSVVKSPLPLLDARCGLSSSARSGSSALKSKVASGSVKVLGSPVVVSLSSDPSSDNGADAMSASSTTIALNQPSAVVGDSASWSSADSLERERSRLEVLGEGSQEVRE